MAKSPTKIILDTNLWISFLITKNHTQLDDILFVKKARLVFSNELLEEFLEVVKRPKIRKYFSVDDLEALLEIIENFSDFVVVTSSIDLCRDSKDNFLLALAVDSNSNYLITGDKDLLDLKIIGKTKILAITDFFKITN